MKQRAVFGSRLSAVLVSAGSAVGLGNIWRFPYIAGENGGGAFLLIYIGCVLIIGLPIMLTEFSIGRATRKNPVGAYKELNKGWSILGYNGVLAAAMSLSFYLVVSGWTLSYLIDSASGVLSQLTNQAQYSEHLNAFMQNPVLPIVYTFIFAAITHVVISLGVQKGIERSAKLLMPLLFFMLIILAINSLAMPNAMQGVEFLFKPDFSKVTASTFLSAVGQAFFSMSIGMGCMITYSSYFKKETNLRRTALSVTALDALVAILAGLVIFPACASTGTAVTEGEALAFVTIPQIFNQMPMGMLWSAIFFALLGVAALTSTISLHEVITSYISEQWHMERKRAAWITSSVTVFMGMLASLSLGIMSDVPVFKFLNNATANVLLPLGGLFTCIFIGWVLPHAKTKEQLSNKGQLPLKIFGTLIFIIKYVAPTSLLLIFLDSLNLI